MRIDAYNQIAQVYGVQKVSKTQKAQSTSRLRDQVSISQAGRDYQVAKNAVSEASDIREDKVAQLKSQIGAGTYSVEVGSFASKLLEKYQ
ncbi:MAG: flagellar biosynthesis anti-sigma factor FlgM [Agathobacter sp.]|nr:flagellar biosynthesis anti-sigma factor FlgM [Agathobacter sp.]